MIRVAVGLVVALAASCGSRDEQVTVVVFGDGGPENPVLKAMAAATADAALPERECLTAPEIDEALKPVINSLAGDTSLDGVAMVEDPPDADCWKQRFTRGSYRIVVYRKHDRKVQGIAGPKRPTPSAQCLADAKRQAESIASYADWLTARHAAVDPDADDLELGWPAWIECDEPRAKPSSVATWLHEATHSARRGSCLADPLHRGERCIEDVPLPHSSIAALTPSELRAVPHEGRGIVTSLQQIYFSPEGKSFRTVLDELTAFAVDTDVQAAQLEQQASSHGAWASRRRPILATPVFLYLAIRYFAALDRAPAGAPALDPDLRRVIVAMFDDADTALERWLRAVAAMGGKPIRIESWAIQRYRASAKPLLARWRR